MSATIVPSLYDAIVSDVVEQSRADFQEDGIDEATLQEFYARWTEKIAATGATATPEERLAAPVVPDDDPVHETLTTASQQQFQGGNALSAMRAAQQQQARSHGSHNPTGQAIQAASHSNIAVTNGRSPEGTSTFANGNADIKMEPDLPNSMSSSDMLMSSSQQSSSPRKRALSLKSSEQSEQVPQKVKKAPRSDIDLDDEAINSDLDDSDDDALRGDNEDDEDGDIQTVLCLFEHVRRTKNKWKCVLKDGIVNVNGRDFAFNKANGEFEW